MLFLPRKFAFLLLLKKTRLDKRQTDRCKPLGCVRCALTLVTWRSTASVKKTPCWDCKSCCHASAMYPGLDKSTLDINTCYRNDSNLLLPLIEVVLVEVPVV